MIKGVAGGVHRNEVDVLSTGNEALVQDEINSNKRYSN